jgi:glycosyltransferase involved in cell wall biosynthesis
MKILVVHNRYRIPGGEDSVFADENNLLESNGHSIVRYVRSNDEINSGGLFNASLQTIWSQSSYKDVRQVLVAEKPDIIHVHNFFPLISPSIFYAAQSMNIPVVQTLHNYRLWCLNAYFFREGGICEDCKDSPFLLPGIRHQCYRNSLAASTVLATMLSVHRALPTWDKVDVFITLSKFAQNKFIEYGLPAHKMRLKPNFVHPAPLLGDGRDNSVLYVGRLSPEKGIDTLLSAWSQLGNRITLKIAGSGPLQKEVESVASQNSGVQFLGQQPSEEIYRLLGQSKALIFPSLWYEGMPRTIIEAFATGTPVIASNLGAMATMIDSGRTGLHFEPGNVDELVQQVLWMLEHPSEWQVMRQKARQEFEAKYTAEQNYALLMDIYQQALSRKSN